VKAICFDPVGGASGDKILSSLLDLGVDAKEIDKSIRSTGLKNYEMSFSRESYANGVRAGFLQVTYSEDRHHRRFGDIEGIIRKGKFPKRVTDRALAIYSRLAEAEATIHGIPAPEVQFHEVGAVDSIIDILGTALALESLEIEKIFCSPIPIGRGTVTTAHGAIPAPAPATVQMLKGYAIIRLNHEHELTTPTGAAILTTLSSGDWSGHPMVIQGVGSGRGNKELKGLPNVLRAFLVDIETIAPELEQEIEVIETDVNDDTPEMMTELTDVLREAGAVDVTLIPILAKAGRPALRLTVLCPKGETAQLSGLMFNHCRTVGIRVTTARRLVLPQTDTLVETPWGLVEAKKVKRPNRTEIVPEFETCRRIAKEHHLSIRQVMQKVIHDAESK
jgi:uncharacterized protein (TIGR00299 family) protein